MNICRLWSDVASLIPDIICIFYFPYMSIYRFINFIELLKESAFGLLFFSIFPPIFYFIVSVLVFILPIV